jgi:hypothetical protein
MGHAIYCFLFDTIEERMPLDATRQEMAEQLQYDFDGYIETYGSDDSWNTALVVLFPDGDVIRLDNGRGEEFYKTILANLAEEREPGSGYPAETWDEVLKIMKEGGFI